LGQHLYIFASQACDIQTLLYVYDKDDAQILQDAIDVQADYLITQNTKDFDERKIFDTR
jgi:predicted nucleic acid-binding protein